MEVKFKEMNAIFERTDAIYHKAAKLLGVSDVELFILYVLTEAEGKVPQKNLYNEVGISKSTVNSSIKKMEKDGIIIMKALDGRSTEVQLTEKGREFAANTAAKIIEIENRIFESWTAKERELAIKLNRDYMEKFSAEVEKLAAEVGELSLKEEK